MSQEKVALITGANGGFGRVTTEALARDGFTVFAAMRGLRDKNAGAAREIEAWAAREKREVFALELDVTDDASVDTGVALALERTGTIDVVVSNAGVMGLGHAETYSAARMREMFEVNLFGAQRLARAALPAMRKSGRGLIVFVSSAVGRIVVPAMGVYCASKFALEALAESYRYEVGPLGVDIAIVEPGVFPTGIETRGIGPDDADRSSDYGVMANLVARMGGGIGAALAVPNPPRAEEVAQAIAQLAAFPAGKRPLRTVVGTIATQGVAEINTICEAVEKGLLTSVGLETS